MIYKMSDTLYNKITRYHSPDGLGVHVNSEFDLDDFAKIIQKNYGLMDLHKGERDNTDDEEYWYHYQVMDKKLFTWFSLRWS